CGLLRDAGAARRAGGERHSNNDWGQIKPKPQIKRITQMHPHSARNPRLVLVMQGHITLITGGARSGKTRYALEAADDITPRTYIATAGLLDDEMRERAARHQRERGTRWRTIEETFELAPLVKDLHGLVVVDCLTLWLSNWMLRDDTQLERQIDLLCAAFHSTRCQGRASDNEVG